MKKRRLNVPQLDWLCDVSGRNARVTSVGGRTLLVENHTGILEFSPTRIRLATRCGEIAVEGAGLVLNAVRMDALTIRGRIRSVQLPDAEDDSHEF